MDTVERELLRAEVDALAGELAEERWRHVAGMEPAPSLAPIFARHGRAAHKETVQALRAGSDEGLATVIASLRVERAQAEDEEAWRAAEAAAVGRGPYGPISLVDAQLAMVSERDRGLRLAFGRAVSDSAALPARDAAVERRARARAEVGLLPDWDQVLEADALLAASDDGYRDVLAWLARREADLAPQPHGDLTRADLLFVLTLHGWEALFPRGILSLAVEQTAAALRLDLSRIRIDSGARSAQWPGAHVQGTRVSLRRRGGPGDWLDLFDAVGQALAAAAAPFHRRHPAAASTAGALLSGLLLDAGFLAARVGVERKHAADLLRVLSVRQLFRLRARAAACRVATEVERGTSGAAWSEAHREAMALAALASWPAGLAARDGDAGAHGAALRGSARAERLRRTLVERCDEDWWKNPRSAEVLASALAAGGAWSEEEPKLALGAEPLLARMQ
jgi:hypothetical protein